METYRIAGRNEAYVFVGNDLRDKTILVLRNVQTLIGERILFPFFYKNIEFFAEPNVLIFLSC